MVNTKRSHPLPAATRDRLIAYFREHPTGTAVEISRAWGLTQADIRYHLKAMMDEGLLEIIPRDPSQVLRRGRPKQIYRLAAHALPSNLAALCSALLDQLLSECTAPGEKEARLREIAAQLAGSLPTALTGTQRLNQAAAVLNRQAYRAHWEAHSGGPRILLRSCPYTAVLPRHPELCELDRCLIEHLIHMPVRHTARMNPRTGSPAACVFTPVES